MGIKHTRHDLTGKRFGKLVALSFIKHKTKGSNNQSKWLCRCDCGVEKAVFRGSLLNGATTSCGCSVRTANGDARRKNKAPEYEIWRGMKKRCENKRTRSWPHYGGRGIRVCAKWSKSYLAFLSDVGRRPSKHHSIDRINNDGNYEPGNVRWADGKTQIANRRPVPRLSWRESAKHAYGIVRDFETVIADYTGAPYAVAVDSCTNALLLACAYVKAEKIEIPKHTYVGVAQSILNAGAKIRFREEKWTGMYQLQPSNVFDAARLFTSKMYMPGTVMCLSFHWTKHLPIGRGGAILCDDRKAVNWFKKARFDGRSEGKSPRNDKFDTLGWHVLMAPDAAAQGLMLMAGITEHNEPLPWGPGTNSDYPDLSTMPIFKGGA